MFRSASLRLAALYTAAFAISVVLLGAITLFTTRAALTSQFNSRIRSDSAALVAEYRIEGLSGVVQAVRERDATPGALDYGLTSPAGAAIAGRLAGIRTQPGWSVLNSSQPREDAERLSVYSTVLPGGYRLLVGDEHGSIDALDGVLLQRFVLAFLGVVLIGIVGGIALSRGVNRKIAAIAGTAEAIIDGDLHRRVPIEGSGDDLDRLAATLNRMLDRIGTLMESLRQVSTDIAHDLRTPLTRLKGRLEALAGSPRVGRAETLESAMADLDNILGTFAALLRISQIESGARRAAFRSTDLTQLARTVVEAFAPSAEDAGAELRLDAGRPLFVDGDPALLTQMLVNLVENSLRHAGSGAAIVVRCALVADAWVISVIDNGPGVPPAERERLFDRFYRLQSSRSTPGSGLGLALVAAVARLHGAKVSLHDARPGLEARVAFPDSSKPRPEH
ncbi:MAG TPA: HAMP domain-containing sensor histidine kinase [Caulobacteraceae bacterium]